MRNSLNKAMSVALTILLLFTMIIPSALAEGVPSSDVQINEGSSVDVLVEETELSSSGEEELQEQNTLQSSEESTVTGDIEPSVEDNQPMQKETLVQAASDDKIDKELISNIITNITLNDESGADLTQKESIKKDSKARVVFEYALPDGEVFEGDTFTLNLPAELKALQGSFELEAKDESGNKLKDKDGNEYSFGTGVVKDGQVTITFSEHVEQDGVKGNFEFDVQFNEEKIGDANPVPIEFKLKAEKTKEITLNFEQYQKVEPTITKKYIDFDKSTKVITWEVLVSAGSEEIKKVEFIDKIQEGQKYIPNSFKVGNQEIKDNLVIVDDDGELKYTIDSIAKESTEKITFQTEILDEYLPGEDETKTYMNIASIKPEGYENKISSKEAKIELKSDIIEKSGKEEKTSDGTFINWTIVINKEPQKLKDDNGAIKLNDVFEDGNVTLEDVLGEGLELVEGSIEVFENGKKLSEINNLVRSGTKDFTYEFKGSKTTEYKITYTTKVTDNNFLITGEKKSFHNTATLTGASIVKGKASALAGNGKGFGISPNRIYKSGTYNPSTHEITWKIDVNNDNVQLDNVIVTDHIPKGQTYVPDSLQLNGESVKHTYTPATDDKEKSGTVEYKFEGSITSKQIITFKTTVDSNKDYATNIDKNKPSPYYNQAQIKNNEVTISSNKAQVDVTSSVIKKAVAEKYDYVNRTIKWKLTINENKMPLTNIVVKDPLPAEFVLDGKVTTQIKGSEDIIEYEVNGTKPSDKALGTFSLDANTNTLVFTADQAINNQFDIIFTTKVSDPDTFFKPVIVNGNQTNKDMTITNIASITATEIPGAPSDLEDEIIKNNNVTKSGTSDLENKSITWKVAVNPHQINLPQNAKIKDTLQKGLELDIDSIKLYSAAVDSGTGALSKEKDGEEIKLDDSNIQYDGITRQFDFIFPGKIDPKKAYILEFKTDVMEGGKYSNSVIFTGEGMKLLEQAGEESFSKDSMSGTGTGHTKTLKLVKKDKDTGETLEGAEFKLYMKHPRLGDAETYVRTVTSGQNGEVLVERLRSNIEYVLKEVKAPTNYQLNNEAFIFTLETKDETIYLNDEPLKDQYEFLNEKIKADIELIKKGKDNQPLAGAEFTIYAENNLETAITTAISGTDGKVVFEKMPIGDYVIKETKAPTGYHPSKQELTAAVTSSETVKANPYEITNERIKGEIQFNKVNASGQPLADAEFTLYDEDGKEIAKSVSTEAGLVEFKDVEYGDYKIKETKAPKGYQLSGKTVSVTVNGEEGQRYSVVDFVNYRYVQPSPIQGIVKLVKTNEDGEPIAGAEFELYNANGIKVGTAISNSDGVVQFAGVEHGTYKMKETKAPVGYHLLSEALEVKVNGTEGQVYDLGKVQNKSIKGTVKIKKTDDSGKSLEGAEFTLFEEDGKKVTTATSNEQGFVQFTGVSYGLYTVKETKAPKGYHLSPNVLSVTVNGAEGQIYDLGTIQNSKIKGTIEILKTDEAGKPLAGAEFTLFAEDGIEVAKQVSNSEGVVTFKDVPYGKYTVKESQAPAGYILNAETLNIAITEETVYKLTAINKKEDINKPGNPKPIHPDDDSEVDSVTDFVQGNSGSGSGSNTGAVSSGGSRNPQVGSGTLPDTGGPYYNYLMIGSIIGGLGIILLTADRLRRRKAEM